MPSPTSALSSLTTGDGSVLFRVLADLNLANAASNDCEESEFILEDLDRLNAPDPLDPLGQPRNLDR